MGSFAFDGRSLPDLRRRRATVFFERCTWGFNPRGIGRGNDVEFPAPASAFELRLLRSDGAPAPWQVLDLPPSRKARALLALLALAPRPCPRPALRMLWDRPSDPRAELRSACRSARPARRTEPQAGVSRCTRRARGPERLGESMCASSSCRSVAASIPGPRRRRPCMPRASIASFCKASRSTVRRSTATGCWRSGVAGAAFKLRCSSDVDHHLPQSDEPSTADPMAAPVAA